MLLNSDNTVVICCRTIEKELCKAMESAGIHYRCEFLSSGLHISPSKLKAAIEECMQNLKNNETVLLCMGTCGNAIIGLNTENHRVILPRCDDCITLLLGSMERRKQLTDEYAGCFYTKGWIDGEANTMREYKNYCELYDEETALEMMQDIYAHYRSMVLLDTGISNMTEIIDATKEISNLLNLKQVTVPASLNYIVELLSSPEDDRKFISFPPNHVITEEDLRLI